MCVCVICECVIKVVTIKKRSYARWLVRRRLGEVSRMADGSFRSSVGCDVSVRCGRNSSNHVVAQIVRPHANTLSTSLRSMHTMLVVRSSSQTLIMFAGSDLSS